ITIVILSILLIGLLVLVRLIYLRLCQGRVHLEDMQKKFELADRHAWELNVKLNAIIAGREKFIEWSEGEGRARGYEQGFMFVQELAARAGSFQSAKDEAERLRMEARAKNTELKALASEKRALANGLESVSLKHQEHIDRERKLKRKLDELEDWAKEKGYDFPKPTPRSTAGQPPANRRVTASHPPANPGPTPGKPHFRRLTGGKSGGNEPETALWEIPEKQPSWTLNKLEWSHQEPGRVNVIDKRGEIVLTFDPEALEKGATREFGRIKINWCGLKGCDKLTLSRNTQKEYCCSEHQSLAYEQFRLAN
ncbi:MAG: hypothetical protein AAF804_20090, partial [Bacteroidota bacterium]